MDKFLNDMIHMTEGERLVEYWWLWLFIALLSFYLVKKKQQIKKIWGSYMLEPAEFLLVHMKIIQ